MELLGHRSQNDSLINKLLFWDEEFQSPKHKQSEMQGYQEGEECSIASSSSTKTNEVEDDITSVDEHIFEVVTTMYRRCELKCFISVAASGR